MPKASNTPVCLVRCEGYQPDAVRSAVAEIARLLPEMDALFARGQRVLLKPNLLSSTHSVEEAVNTHPAVIEALAERAVERGAEVFVGDSCGSLSLDSTRRALEITGLPEVARRTGAKLVNFDREPCVELRPPAPSVLESFRAPRIATEVDAIVTVPKLKTHGLTLLTGAVKNLLGLLPGKDKKDVHVMAPKPDLLARALVDIYSALPPRLAVMDAVVGMEGEGPAGGSPRHVGAMLAAADSVALDAVAGALMGLAPRRVATTLHAADRGLGVGDLARIDLRGQSLADMRPETWALPSATRARSALWKCLPTPLASWAFDQAGTAYATVNRALCRECGLCAQNCPVGAIEDAGGPARVERRRCIACYCCAEVCPRRAIEMRLAPLAAGLRRVSRLLRR